VPETETHFKCACRHCAGHIEFPSSGVGETILCPHCGCQTILHAPLGPASDHAAANPQAPPRRKLFTIIIGVALLAAAGGVAAWCFLANRSAPPPAPGNTLPAKAAPSAPEPVVPVPPPDLWHGLFAGPVTLEKAENGDLVYAVGVLSNQSGRQRFGIKVQLDLLDEQGEKVGSAGDYVASILPGKEWKFKALVLERKTARAELVNVAEQE